MNAELSPEGRLWVKLQERERRVLLAVAASGQQGIEGEIVASKLVLSVEETREAMRVVCGVASALGITPDAALCSRHTGGLRGTTRVFSSLNAQRLI